MNPMRNMVLLLSLVVVLAGCAGDDPRSPLPAPDLETRQLTDNEALEANPVYSPDGQWIVFESDRTGNHELWRLPVAGGPAEQLTDDKAFDSAPDVTPDGRGLVFESDRSGTKNIWLLDLLDTAHGSVALTTGDHDDGSPAVSPLGDVVVFESNRAKNGGSDLWLVALAGGEPLRLTTTPAGTYVRTADWSPDGERLVFEANFEGAPALYTMAAGGGAMIRITTLAGYEGHPAWSPDGLIIACESTLSGTMEIHLVPADGGAMEQLTVGGGFWPQWSPDGYTIVYGVTDGAQPEVWTVKFED